MVQCGSDDEVRGSECRVSSEDELTANGSRLQEEEEEEDEMGEDEEEAEVEADGEMDGEDEQVAGGGGGSAFPAKLYPKAGTAEKRRRRKRPLKKVSFRAKVET